MSGSELSPQASCGCCAGVEASTPASIDNRAGLAAIAYRVGTHGDFLASLLARLSAPELQALAKLRTRDPDDFSIALLDAFACVADVLSFYQERIANESYLRTATERRSLAEMARLISYKLKPGLAAETWLAFALEETPGAPLQLTLEPGIRVQSVPGPNEKPQTFETLDSLDARVAWNALRPRLGVSSIPTQGSTSCWLKGADLNLKIGDGVLFVGAKAASGPFKNNWDFRVIGSIMVDAIQARTQIGWQPALAATKTYMQAGGAPHVHVFRRKAAVFGHNAPLWRTMPKDFKDNYEAPSMGFALMQPPNLSAASGNALGALIPIDFDDEWPNFTISPSNESVDLDALYPPVAKPGWVALAKADLFELYRIGGVSETSRAEFAMSGKVTRVKLEGDNYASFKFGVRETSVYVASDELQFAEAPNLASVSGANIDLEVRVDDLPPWRPLLVTGEVQGQAVAEAVTLDHVEPLGSRSRLVLTAALKHAYKRDTVRILANAARASHGESVSQILGSGDAGRAHQRFELKHAPITFLSAESETGARSTLALRVNDVAWQEAATLFDATADRRAYTLRSEEDGRSHVQFGDGRRGARLPSGQENVRVRYRKGLGAAGNVAVGQLSQLMTRPLGLKSASNPLPAEGGTDPEPEAQARQSMPLGVRTLGRAVSVLDYEDFARGFAGIAKAQAAVLNLRAGRAIFVTVAGENGARPAANSPVRAKLVGALKKSGDPLTRFEVQPYDIAHFRLGLKIKRHPDHEPKLVLAAVEQALRRSFSFEARALGQPVALSEVIAVIEQVSGVIATDVDRFYRGTIVKREARLFARRPHVTTAGVGLPAELLTLAPEPLDHLELLP